jgi:hypothetical protein
MRHNRLWSWAITSATVALLVSACGGGGNGGGGTSPTIAVGIQNAEWVAYQDGANGEWTTLSASDASGGSVPATAPDGRYSLAFVCSGTKPTVYVIHATRQELPQVEFTCPSTPQTVSVDVSVAGLNGGKAAVSIGNAAATLTNTQQLSVAPGTHDVIAVRFTNNDIPNRVWVERNRSFTSNTTYTIDFTQADSGSVRVLDINAGALTVLGLSQSGETAVANVTLQSSSSLIIGLGTTLSSATPIAYPIIPGNILEPNERFLLSVRDNTGRRSVERALTTLPDQLTVELPSLFTAPTFSAAPSGAVRFVADNITYPETSIIGYRKIVDAGNVRYEYFMTSGWLGSAPSYTTPVLESLAGWNPALSLQRGVPADVALSVYISPNLTPEWVWRYTQGALLPNGSVLRIATTPPQTITP